MTSKTVLVVLLAIAAAGVAAPAASAADLPGGTTGGDVCVNSTCGPELLPVDCSFTVFFPSARCGFG